MRPLTAAAATLGLGSLLLSPCAFAQTNSAPGVDTVVTVLAKHNETPMKVAASALTVKVDGKKVEPLDWQAYGDNGPLQIVFLIDDSLRTSFGRSLDDVANFIQTLPPNVSVGVAYMQNGAAVFASPLSTDHSAALHALHLPGGSPGSNASPYFCLQDLAARWPAPMSEARREVVMITDGVDPYNLRYDPEDPYLTAAINASNRAHLVVFPIFWHNQGFLSRTFYETNAGQNYLFQVADATGGTVYYEGTMNPVSLVPYFKDLTERLNNQYNLEVPVRPDKKVSYANLQVKADDGIKLRAANQIAVPALGSPATP